MEEEEKKSTEGVEEVADTSAIDTTAEPVKEAAADASSSEAPAADKADKARPLSTGWQHASCPLMRELSSTPPRQLAPGLWMVIIKGLRGAMTAFCYVVHLHSVCWRACVGDHIQGPSMCPVVLQTTSDFTKEACLERTRSSLRQLAR